VADVAALVLAAGAGRRFLAAGGSGSKVLADVDGQPLLTHVLALAAVAGLDPILVVVPPEHDALLAAMVLDDRVLGDRVLSERGEPRSRVRTVVNPSAALGMGTSLAAGLEALAHDGDADACDACVVLLADQPRIDPDVITRVVQEWRHTDRPVRADYEDGPGHPVLLPRRTWDTVLLRLRDPDQAADEGARGMLTGLGAVTLDVEGPMPIDVDVPTDLEDAARTADGHDGGRTGRRTEDSR